jgi:hypothetical protein
VIGPVFAAPGVAAKETAENTIAAAAAIMEIIFMFRLQRTGCPSPKHARRIREYNLKRINLVCLDRSAARVLHDPRRLTFA